MKTISAVITKVPAKQHVWRGFGKTMPPSSEPPSLKILPCEAAAYMLGVSLFPLRVINSKIASRAILALVQDGVHPLGDRHLDPVSSRQSHSRCRGENSLRHRALHSGENLRQCFSAAQFNSHIAIA
jgi:hypothetical protein